AAATADAAQAQGASLVEAMVAMLVFAVGVAAVVPLFLGAIRSTRAARDHGAAAWLARQKLEELRSRPYAALHASPAGAVDADTPGYVDYLDQHGAVLPAGGVYVRRWAVELAAADGSLLRLTVAVHHVGAPGVAATLATLRRLP